MSRRGISLSEFIVAVAVLALITGFLGQFYVLMGKVYDEVSVHADLQRNLRKIASWVFSEFREASPTSFSNPAILLPNHSQTTSTILRFTTPVDINQPRTTAFQTIRYYYDAGQQKLFRQLEGSSYSREICADISQLNFTWINDYTVLLQFTVAKTVRGANGMPRTVSSNSETYINIRYSF